MKLHASSKRERFLAKQYKKNVRPDKIFILGLLTLTVPDDGLSPAQAERLEKVLTDTHNLKYTKGISMDIDIVVIPR